MATYTVEEALAEREDNPDCAVIFPALVLKPETYDLISGLLLFRKPGQDTVIFYISGPDGRKLRVQVTE